MSKLVKSKVEKKDLALILIIVILIIFILTLVSKKFVKPNEQPQQSNEIRTTEESDKNKENVQVDYLSTNEEKIKYLSNLGERDRIEFYCNEFLKCIQNENYEEAYNLLYNDFKQNYFPTFDEFKDYIKKTYPYEFAVDYDDITRQGDIYVLRLKILDVLGSRENEKIQRIVIRENNYNDFVISFQVI